MAQLSGINKQYISDTISKLSGFSRKADNSGNVLRGTTRLAYSDEEKAAARFLRSEFKRIGLYSPRDFAGNMYGVRKGDGRPTAILTGSHLDTVWEGGNYDGAAGVACALAVMDCLQRSQAATHHSIVAVGWRGEESVSFKFPYVGASMALGNIDAEKLLRKHEFISGTLLSRLVRLNKKRLQEFGFTNKEIFQPVIDERTAGNFIRALQSMQLLAQNLAAYLEVHIEQGPVLEREGAPVSAVNAISGNYRFSVKFTGEADHSGAMPMEYRADAGFAAAELTSEFERLAASLNSEEDRQQLRELRISPVDMATLKGGPTTVAWNIQISFDVRCCQTEKLASFRQKAQEIAHAISVRRGVGIEIMPKTPKSPIEEAVFLDNQLISSVQAEVLGARAVSRLFMPSGAGHDAKLFVKHGVPTGMYFIPCKDGRSHRPDEFASTDSIAVGAEVLLETIIKLDERAPPNGIEAHVPGNPIRIFRSPPPEA